MTRQCSPHFATYYRWLILTHHLGVKLQADSILDVGCNDGHFLSGQAGRIKVGVDIRPRLSPDGDQSIVQADGCLLPFADGSFSAILTIDVIEHVLDDNAFIASITRVLARGGHLWLSTPTETAHIFPAWLMHLAMKGWGHQRVGYDVDDLVRRFPPGYHVQATLWNATSFRLSYVLLRVLRMLSPSLSCFLARLCFEIDRRLSGRCDHIFLHITREVTCPRGSSPQAQG